ncbi:MAG TPA: aspartate--tRNA ligase [Dehalococcoidia bacterium]|nr:aspartate--tRNA ligase [Dehalococcoidia bacterium]
MLKTDYCGDLRATDEGREVVLAGWVHRRRDHGGLIFIDLRDSRGLVQAVFHPQEAPEAHAVASDARNEYVLQVRGTVARRRPGTENEKLATGAIEVRAAAATVLNPAKTPPFYINEDVEVDEMLRLRYRYLDLRRERMHANIVLRSRITKVMRDYLFARGFTEIETPALANPTPEGSRDYLVPSRINPGNFYALPQSPQQFKQLLMVAGFERYFQIAKCYRDEDLRADRQPEFTQLDLEMSFVEQEDILRLIEELYVTIARELRPDLTVPVPFTRMPYEEAMRRFGSDKPDLRYGLELVDLTNVVRGTQFMVFKSATDSNGRVEGIVVPGGAGFTRKEIDELTETVKTYGAKGLVSLAYGADPATATDEEIRSPVLKFIGGDLARSMGKVAGAKAGDLLLAVAGVGGVPAKEPGSAGRVKPALDALRRALAAKLDLADPNTLKFCWILEFPLFEWSDEDERYYSVTHPFTAPVDADADFLRDPAAAHSKSHDLTCNGQEIGGGSVRIHSREMQQAVFRALNLSDEETRERFAHMLEAFEYGAPPHGGIAMGLERTVALFAQDPDIREVMAFPKTKTASDPMTGAPLPVTAEQLAELGLQLRPSS